MRHQASAPATAPLSSLLSLLALAFVATGCASPLGRTGAASDARTPPTALEVDSAVVAMSAAPLWPGFVPLSTPVAIFDGARTYLFRHPSPPAGYAAVQGRTGVVSRAGRDSAITANTSAVLGGVPTATVMLDPRSSVRDAAAVTIHELFHVFQRATHPDWQANEADLFTYPIDDVRALALRRQETSALSGMVAAPGSDARRCLALTFLAARAQRFRRLGASAAAYERGTELNEGLAQYVERRAASRSVALSPLDAPAAHVRQRAYEVGAALAGALDLLRPDWQRTLDEAHGPTPVPLDSLLSETVSDATAPAGCAAPTSAESTSWLAMADIDVRAIVAERERTRAEFLARPGWRLVVDAGAAPLFPAGFDPLNVSRLSPTEILHTRYLKLTNAHGAMELLGGTALTQGRAGQHPLFGGVARATMTGLVAVRAVRDSAGVVVVDAPGVTARLALARVDTAGETITVHWR